MLHRLTAVLTNIRNNAISVSKSVILHGRYRVDTFLKFEFNEFFNFSFSVDIDNRMLTFFSSNTLLGTYLLPDIKHMPYQKIEFASSNSAIASACKFDRLTVYKTARRYQTPPVSAINYVQLTGWSISPKVPCCLRILFQIEYTDFVRLLI